MHLDYSCIFLDFDGVIKESVEAKSEAFESLFLAYGKGVASRVRRHHEQNSGVSRFDKLPIYLQWAGLEVSESQITEWSDRFSALVKQRVIDSDWVPGILEFLQKKAGSDQLFVVTATPQAEIEEIIDQLGIAQYFSAVIGAPTPKTEAIQTLLQQFTIQVEQAVMVGDAGSDYQAAKANQVDFILRRTELNQELQDTLGCSMVNDFTSTTEVI